MQRISLEVYTSAYEAVKMLTAVPDQRLELEIPAGSVLLDNILNLKLILQSAKKAGKTVSFVTSDPFGQNLIRILNGESEERAHKNGDYPEGVAQAEPAVAKTTKETATKASLPKIGLPKITFNFKKIGLIVPILFVILIGLGLVYLKSKHRAEIVLYFSPQKSVKSTQIKIGDGMKTDLEKKTLAGLRVAKTLSYTTEIASTGVKLEGEKAKGKITLYNSTEEDITLKKGARVTYKKDDASYVFTTDEDVTVPARTDSPPPDTTIIKGTAEVTVTAEAIGDAYNIKKEREFSVKGYKSSQLTASNAEDFKGGSSKEIRVVTQEDLNKLERELGKYIEQMAPEALKSVVASGFDLIDKSQKVGGKSVILANKAGDEKSKLSGSITAQVEGLTYSKAELNNLMEKLSANLVPPGFEFYSYSRDLQVEVLGNTESTVVSPTEADLQVTFRFFIVPKIDKTKVFESVSGKNPQEALDILKKINGVESASLRTFSDFPLFKNVPARESAVKITTKVQE